MMTTLADETRQRSVFQACLLPACTTSDFGVCFSFCLCLLSFSPSLLLPHQTRLPLINLLPSTSFHQPLSINLFSSTSFHQPLSINLFPSTSFHQSLAINLSSSTAFRQSLSVDRFSATSGRQPLCSNHCSSASARQAVFVKLCSSSSPRQRHAINLCSKRSVKLSRPKFVFLQPPLLHQSFCTVRPSESSV